jgi:hypothetical protein
MLRMWVVTSPLHPRDGTEPLAAANPGDHVPTDRPPTAGPESPDARTFNDDDLVGADGAMDPRVIHERLAHIAAHVERLAAASGQLHQPAWLRRTAEEPRLPVAVAVACAVALQAFVPHQFAFPPWWLLPSIEVLLGVTIILFRQTKIDRQARILRVLSLSLAIAAGLATAWSAGHLIDELIRNPGGPLSHAGTLLRVGGSIWLTNVIVFALWYWDLDRGGPAARACGDRTHTDFLFAEMTAPEFAAKDWEPRFVDYLYLSFTNSTAFSPTDTLPLTRWAKLTMMFQSAVSLATVALVVARAVNVL